MTRVVGVTGNTSRPWVFFASILVLVASLLGCSSGAAPAASGTQPAGGTPPATVANNPAPAPGGATTFHLVLSDGPKAGTYDVSTNDPGACSTADTGYFAADFNGTGGGLTYIDASKQPTVTGLLYGFDTLSDNQILFTGTGTVTVDVNDTGTTASVHVVSNENMAASDNPPSSTKTGQAELTVNCASVLRPNQ